MEFIIKNISHHDIERAGRVFKAGKERHIHIARLEREITACPHLVVVHEIRSAYDKKIKPAMQKPTWRPKISVIMLVKDSLEYTRKCLDSLVLYTSNYELIIIDNGSNKETIDYLKGLDQFENYRLILNDKNLGVPYGWDQGIKIAKHDYIAIINNDLIFTPNWLNHLQKCFEDKLDCAVASPTTCFSSGLQCDQDLKPKRFEMSQEEINDYASGLEFGYVDTEVYGFAFLTHRKVIEKIGVFDWSAKYKEGEFICGHIPEVFEDFEDNLVEEIRAFHFLEHVPQCDVIKTFNEVYRILILGGIFDIYVPPTTGRGAFSDPTHVSFWNDKSWHYYDMNWCRELSESYGIKCDFQILENKTLTEFNLHAILKKRG